MRRFALLCVLCSLSMPALAQDPSWVMSLPKNGDPRAGVTKSPELVQAIEAGFTQNELAELKFCATEKELVLSDFGPMFVAYQTLLAPENAPAFLVEPETRKHFCNALIGAHTQELLVVGGLNRYQDDPLKVLLRTREDDLNVLVSRTEGWRDIETNTYFAAGAQVARTLWKFNGSVYARVSCTYTDRSAPGQPSRPCNSQ